MGGILGIGNHLIWNYEEGALHAQTDVATCRVFLGTFTLVAAFSRFRLTSAPVELSLERIHFVLIIQQPQTGVGVCQNHRPERAGK